MLATDDLSWVYRREMNVPEGYRQDERSESKDRERERRRREEKDHAGFR